MTIRAPELRLWGPRVAALGLGVHALFLAVSIAGTQIGLGVLAAGVLLSALGGLAPKRTPLDLPIACIVGAAVLSDLWSPYGAPSLEMATLWRSLLGFWLVSQALSLSAKPDRDVTRALLLAMGGLALAALVGMAQYRTGLDPVHALGLRAEPKLVAVPGVEGRFVALGFFVSRLTLSHVSAFLLALSCGALLSRFVEGRARTALLIATALGFIGLVLTFARAAWLGMGAALLVLTLLGTGSAQQRKAARWSVLALIAAAALCLLHPGVRGRLASAFDLQANSDRLFLWARALEIIRDHPLRGVGFGNYQRICGPYYDRVDPHFLMRTFAHNSALTILAETGPLGLLAALFFVTSAARMLIARHREGGQLAAGALAALAAACVVAQMHDVHIDNKAMYALWFTLAVGQAAALPRPGRRGDP